MNISGVNMPSHIPKGSMCCVCSKRSERCSELPFKDMPVIERWMGFYVVKCTEFLKKDDNDR